MMLKDLAHAMVHLEGDSEEGLVLDGDLKALQGVASAVHAGEEVEGDVVHCGWFRRKREAVFWRVKPLYYGRLQGRGR